MEKIKDKIKILGFYFMGTQVVLITFDLWFINWTYIPLYANYVNLMYLKC